MNKKNEQGFALVLLLALTAVLMLSLTSAILALNALRRQNKKAKTEVVEKAQKLRYYEFGD